MITIVFILNYKGHERDCREKILIEWFYRLKIAWCLIDKQESAFYYHSHLSFFVYNLDFLRNLFKNLKAVIDKVFSFMQQ